MSNLTTAYVANDPINATDPTGMHGDVLAWRHAYRAVDDYEAGRDPTTSVDQEMQGIADGLDGARTWAVGAFRTAKHAYRDTIGSALSAETRAQVKLEKQIIEQTWAAIESDLGLQAELATMATERMSERPGLMVGRTAANFAVAKGANKATGARFFEGSALSTTISVGVMSGDLREAVHQGVTDPVAIIEQGIFGHDIFQQKEPENQ
jgi:hypothetical protein